MRRHLNVIYVTSEDAWLRKERENVVVEVDGVERGRAPLHMLSGIMCFTRTGASPALMAACAEAGIALSFLTPNGKFLARVEGKRSGNVLLRRRQYHVADAPDDAAPIAASMLAAKLTNQRTVLMRAMRDYGSSMDTAQKSAIDTTVKHLQFGARKLLSTNDIATMRGIEGDAARTYFDTFNILIRNDDPAFRFTGRSRRPPLDRVNAVLSFLYAMLGHDCRSALESVGLDPQVGFIHTDRPGRASLALDMMEELRCIFADRLVFSLINRRQISAKDFVVEDSGAVTIKDDARKAVLVAWQERKQDEIRHPFLDEKITWGLIPHIQAQLLARHLRGDLDGYPAFFWK